MHIVNVHKDHIKRSQFQSRKCAVALACIDVGLKEVRVSFPAICVGNEVFSTSVDVANWILSHDFYMEYPDTVAQPQPIILLLKNGSAEVYQEGSCLG